MNNNGLIKIGLLLGFTLPMYAQAAALLVSTEKKSGTDAYTSELLTASQKKKRSTATVDRLLVKIRHQAISTTLATLQKASRIRKTRSYRDRSSLHVFEVVTGNDIDVVMREIATDPNVEYIERDQQIFLRQQPDDTNYPQQWSLENTGIVGTTDVDINAEQAWDISSGDQNIVVAVIDTGVAYSHVDLNANMWRNPNEIPDNNLDDDNNGYIDDIFGIDTGDGDSDPMDASINHHGTHIAGIIAAKGNNGIGVTGVNWDVSILACKVFAARNDTGLAGFVSSAIECIDYITDLKLNHNINIVAVNSSWGWTGAYSQALRDAIERLGNAGIVFVVAAGNDSVSNDVLIDYPSTYHLSNIISVAAIDSQGQHTSFSNYGSRTVQISAPGQDVLSTLAGSTNTIVSTNPHVDIFFDNVEQGIDGWAAQTPWAIDSQNAYSGVGVWTDSPGAPYANNTDASLQSNTLDLSTFVGSSTYLGFFAKFDLEAGFDLLHVEFSGDNGNTWVVAGHLTGFTLAHTFYEFEIPANVKTANFMMRFHLTSDASITGEGIFIDDIGVGTGPAARVDDRYGQLSGTSMSAPYVAGSLALIKAQDPLRDWTQLKNLIIAGGRPFETPATVGVNPTISNRSLRLVGANGVGSMSCNNQIVKSRLRPSFDNVDLLLGSNETLNIAYLHINCDLPAGELSVTLEDTGEQFMLKDDGLGFDQIAGDGIYSTNIDILSREINVASVRLPDNDLIQVTGKKTYIADDSVTYNWRSLSAATSIIFADNDVTEFFSSPFPIKFDDQAVGFTDVGINENGFIVLQASAAGYKFEGLTYENNRIPNGSTATMIAPFWDDLTGISDRVVWGVVGVAPNRELVISWNNIQRVEETKAGINPSLQGATFQVVFFESNSDVLYNYQNVIFDSATGDKAASATIGIQSSQMQGRTYAYNNAILANQSAILWRTVSLINFPPVIASVSNKSVVVGQSVSFVVDVSDANGVRPILTATGIPNGAVVDFSTGQFDWINATTPGDFPVSFTATDAVDTTLSSQLTVNVRINENFPPTVTAPLQLDVVEGNDVEFQVTASDQNGHLPILTVSELSGDASFEVLDAGRGLFSWSKPPIGNSVVEFIATDAIDSNLFTSKVVSIVVSAKVDETAPTTPGPGKRGIGDFGLAWLLLLAFFVLVSSAKRQWHNG